MVRLFIGLSSAHLLLLCGVFMLGLWAGQDLSLRQGHIMLGIGAAVMTAFTHVAVFTYFMATAKWLIAATAKADLEPHRFVQPAYHRKGRSLVLAMTAIMVTFAAVFAGAAVDTIREVPPALHLGAALAAILANLVCAAGECRLIRQQGALMDQALEALNAPQQAADHEIQKA